MTNPNLTEIVCIIDRSGSMESIRTDAIGGFNAFLAEQQKLPGDAKLTLVLFDHEYILHLDGVPLQDVQPLDETTYVPRGTTALLDAIGRTVDDVGKRLGATPEDERPGKVIVVILTDGLENASRDYTHERVRALITHQSEKYSWEFVFLAANQDAIAAAGQIAIQPQNAVAFAATPAGVQGVLQEASARVTESRRPYSRRGA
jgi:uncharacterized protein YegL